MSIFTLEAKSQYKHNLCVNINIILNKLVFSYQSHTLKQTFQRQVFTGCFVATAQTEQATLIERSQNVLIPQLQLILHQMIIHPPRCGEFVVGAALDDCAAIENENLVGVFDGAEAVGDDENRLAGAEFTELFHDGAFVVGV